MKNIIYIATLCFTLACSSCDRDNLFYATEEQGFVRLNINWEPSQLEPNGTSAYVFDNESGKAVCECLISSDPNTIDIPLYPGKYDIMVINNTEEELASIPVSKTYTRSTLSFRPIKSRSTRIYYQKQKIIIPT